MSLSQSLTAAMSGLTAASRGAQTVATNLANLRTAGYGRRDLLLSSLASGGVLVGAVLRNSTPLITADRRIALAESSVADTRLGFRTALEGWLGTPGTEGSLTTRIGALDSSLLAAAAAPGTEATLAAVLNAAKGLAGSLASVSAKVQQARSTADGAIANDVATLNLTLAQVADLNHSIVKMSALGRDTAALVDQRQVLVDQIAAIVPLREVQRENGQIALYSAGGATLLDGRPAHFGFAQAGVVAADSGALSDLTMNGRPLSAADGAAMGGGRLSANFAIRDDLGPAAQHQLDAIARDLITRMQEADSTLAPGAAGLFTDSGAAFDSARERGLASRIRVNAAVDPAQGGALWRLRDGIGTVSPGDSGNGAGLSAWAAALSEPRTAASGGFLPGLRSLSGLAGDMMSGIATARLADDVQATVAHSRSSALSELEAASGVDSDREMQMLLLIERSYAANAKVIQAVDGMIANLLEI